MGEGQRAASPADMLRAMAYNNAWANHRLLQACCALSQAEFTATRTSFFPSLLLTVQHVLEVDRFYIDALEGGSLGLAAFDLPLPDTAPALKVEQTAWDRRLIALCDRLDDGALNDPVRLARNDHIQVETRLRTLLHLFQHQVHHRGQAHAMLAGTGVKPPQLDEFFFAEEAPLRAGDLQAMGVGEGEIWR